MENCNKIQSLSIEKDDLNNSTIIIDELGNMELSTITNNQTCNIIEVTTLINNGDSTIFNYSKDYIKVNGKSIDRKVNYTVNSNDSTSISNLDIYKLGKFISNSEKVENKTLAEVLENDTNLTSQLNIFKEDVNEIIGTSYLKELLKDHSDYEAIQVLFPEFTTKKSYSIAD